MVIVTWNLEFYLHFGILNDVDPQNGYLNTLYYRFSIFRTIHSFSKLTNDQSKLQLESWKVSFLLDRFMAKSFNCVPVILSKWDQNPPFYSLFEAFIHHSIYRFQTICHNSSEKQKEKEERKSLCSKCFTVIEISTCYFEWMIL